LTRFRAHLPAVLGCKPGEKFFLLKLRKSHFWNSESSSR
jgi:hypothetical protein